MTERINKSWREQRKAVVRTDGEASVTVVYQSLWMAAKDISEQKGCLFETAKKEIRKAIRNGSKRYGCYWSWKEE